MANLTDILNSQSVNSREFKKIELKMIDFDDIIFNKENHFPMSELQVLQDSIKEKGLLNPPIVYSNDDGTYTLISGHRRMSAMKGLIASGVISPEIRCSVIPKPKDKIAEIESIYIANRNRPPLTDSEMQACVNQLIETWNAKPKEERKGRMRDYIATYFQVSPRSLQKFINEYNRLQKGNDENEDEKEDTHVEKQKIKQIKKIKKTLSQTSTLVSEFEDLDFDIYHEHISYEGREFTVNEFLLMLDKLSTKINKYLDSKGE